MAIHWNVRALLKNEGIENGSQLAAWAGITPPVAYRVLDEDTPVERIEVATLETLAKAFRLRSPWKLLLHKPESVTKPRRR